MESYANPLFELLFFFISIFRISDLMYNSDIFLIIILIFIKYSIDQSNFKDVSIKYQVN